MKILFIELYSDIDLISAIIPNINAFLKFKKIGLFTTVQHIEKIESAKKFLEKNGIKVVMKKSQKPVNTQGIKAKYCGQLLGCDSYSAKKMNVDAFLYIGTGEFHPLAIALQTNKPVIKLNPYTKKVEQIDDLKIKNWLARQAARLSKLKESQKIGIIVSTKPGQYKPNIARKIYKKFKNSYLFISDNISPNELINFTNIDAWVNTACPRLVEDSWPKPFINSDEVL